MGRISRELLRKITGAVRSAIDAHPDWTTEEGKRNLPPSIAKRVAGALEEKDD